MLNIGYKFPYSNYSIDILTDTSLPRVVILCFPLDGCGFSRTGIFVAETGAGLPGDLLAAIEELPRFIALGPVYGFHGLESEVNAAHIEHRLFDGFFAEIDRSVGFGKKSANVLPLQKIPHNRLLHQHRLLPCL